MKREYIFICALTLLLYSCSSHTTQEISQAKQDTSTCLKKNKGDENQCLSEGSKIRLGFKCKNTQITGTRLPQRTCTTRAQRDAKRENSKEMVDRMQRAGQPLDGNE